MWCLYPFLYCLARAPPAPTEPFPHVDSANEDEDEDEDEEDDDDWGRPRKKAGGGVRGFFDEEAKVALFYCVVMLCLGFVWYFCCLLRSGPNLVDFQNWFRDIVRN